MSHQEQWEAYHFYGTTYGGMVLEYLPNSTGYIHQSRPMPQGTRLLRCTPSEVMELTQIINPFKHLSNQ
jgi:hypothetical protein